MIIQHALVNELQLVYAAIGIDIYWILEMR
jgi:UDP-N-acetyl-D-mannosaminuronate dehydrogenase